MENRRAALRQARLATSPLLRLHQMPGRLCLTKKKRDRQEKKGDRRKPLDFWTGIRHADRIAWSSGWRGFPRFYQALLEKPEMERFYRETVGERYAYI